MEEVTMTLDDTFVEEIFETSAFLVGYDFETIFSDTAFEVVDDDFLSDTFLGPDFETAEIETFELGFQGDSFQVYDEPQNSEISVEITVPVGELILEEISGSEIITPDAVVIGALGEIVLEGITPDVDILIEAPIGEAALESMSAHVGGGATIRRTLYYPRLLWEIE
jgi:hypothetical protein